MEQPELASSQDHQGQEALGVLPSIELSEPDPLQVERFPTEYLPSAIASMASEVSRVHQVPASMTGPVVLAAVSASLGRSLQVASGPNRTTMGNVYILVSAESGVGKSAVCSSLMEPLYQCESEVRQHWEKEIRPKAEIELDLLETEMSELRKTRPGARPNDATGRHDIMGILHQKRIRVDELKKQLVCPRLVVENVTSEALSTLLANADETIFSCSADASDVFSVLRGGYKKDGSDENIYLKGWSGDHINVDRVNRDPVSLAHPCISALWMTQPRRVNELFDQESFVDGGLLPRFMVCHSQAKPMPIGNGEIPPVDAQVRERYHELLGDLINEYRFSQGEPKVIPVEPTAKRVMVTFYNVIVERRTAGDLQDMGVFAARWAEWAWRMAVILHAAQWGNGAHQNPLTTQTAANAIGLTEWFIGQQLHLLEGIRKQETNQQLHDICELLQKHPEGITSRALQRSRICANATEAQETLDRLVAERCLVKTLRATRGARKGQIVVYLAGPEL